MDTNLDTVLYILGAILLTSGAYLQRRSANALRDVSSTAPELFKELAGYLANSQGSPAELTARVDELDARVRAMARALNDLDEATERRFRRMSARARRADAELDQEEAAPHDPAQQLLELTAASGGALRPPVGGPVAPNGATPPLPRLIPRPRR